MPKCTVIKTGATVVRTTSERVEELKEVIKNIKVPLVGEVGDAVLYDNQSLTFVMVKPENISAENYPLSRYTPIGVVAIPTSHNVYGTGECGVVSLKAMAYSTPDDGSITNGTMYWGYNSLLLGKAMDECVGCGSNDAQTKNVSCIFTSASLPSDIFSVNQIKSLIDPEAFYFDDIADYAPSPYTEDGKFNSDYSLTEEPASEANCLSDFDGVGKTQLILDAVTVSGWKTASSISNSYSSGNYPAACCCWRFHADGTEQGDWYLPACGEVGYVMVRLKKINETVDALITAYGSDVGVALPTDSNYLWSSAEYSSSNARYVGMGKGYVGNYGKNDANYVRAFLRV